MQHTRPCAPMKVPTFMLKKLYVPGSLAAEGDGFAFKLRNTLAKATITAPPEVQLDGTTVSGDRITFVIGDERIEGATIGPDDTFVLDKGAEVLVTVAGEALAAGAHKLRIHVESNEWDTIAFEVEDTA